MQTANNLESQFPLYEVPNPKFKSIQTGTKSLHVIIHLIQEGMKILHEVVK